MRRGDGLVQVVHQLFLEAREVSLHVRRKLI